MATIDAILPPQGVALFERMRRVKGCGLVKGNVTLGVALEISKAHAKPRVTLSTYQSGCSS